MTNLDPHPVPVDCGDEAQGHGATVIDPREVPLGGPRAMTVRRSLPARGRTTIGAWCFLDHYGPDEVAETGGMVIPPHPHTSLQTVSWLFTGRIEHRDSTGVRAHVVPGELNLMTAGHGVCHSEVSVREEGASADGVLHGVQLWTVLPKEHADVEPRFQHYEPEPYQADGVRTSVFLGTLAVGGTELSSPVPTYSPLLGAELVLEPDATAYLGVDPAFEHGVLLDQGQVHASGTRLEPHQLSHHPPGPRTMELLAGPEGARVILIGGPPFEEQIVMWWNFIGRSHEEVVRAREQWNAEEGAAADGRFGTFDYPDGQWLPAPALPRVRLRPRR